MKVVCIDFETANRHYCSACSVGIAVVGNGVVTESRHWLIKPHYDYGYFDGMNVSVHGITPEQVKTAPEFDSVYSELLPYFENAVLAAHYAVFDMSVLRKSLEIYGIQCPDLNYICTRNIARKVWKLDSYRLNAVSEHLFYHFQHHDALEDALACSNILRRAMAEKGIPVLDEFIGSLGLCYGNLRKPSSSGRKV